MIPAWANEVDSNSSEARQYRNMMQKDPDLKNGKGGYFGATYYNEPGRPRDTLD
jgi:hypothetical protein